MLLLTTVATKHILWVHTGVVCSTYVHAANHVPQIRAVDVKPRLLLLELPVCLKAQVLVKQATELNAVLTTQADMVSEHMCVV